MADITHERTEKVQKMAEGPIQVLIASSGEPDLLRAQVGLLRAFSAEALTIIVVNDAKNADEASSLAAAGRDLNVEVLRYPQDRHTRRLRPPRISRPSTRNAEALQFGFDEILSRGDCRQLAIIDFDMFPFCRFSFRNLLAGHDMAIIPQIRRSRWFNGLRIYYPWVGCLLMDIERLPTPRKISFAAGWINGLRGDTGSKIHRYLTKNPKISIRELSHSGSGAWRPEDISDVEIPAPLLDFAREDPANIGGRPFSEIYMGCFFHLRGASNWNARAGDDDHSFRRRIRLFTIALESILERAQPLLRA